MSSGEIFVLCLVGLAIFGRLARNYMRHRETTPDSDHASRSRVEQLEQRVQTLERIVTDKGYDLKREFEQL